MKRKIKILLATMVLGLLVACNKNEDKVVDYVFLYPEIDDQVLADLENGHYTSYFNKGLLAYEYLATVYPEKDFELVGTTASDIEADLVFKERDTDFKVKLNLEKVDLEGPNETLSIWTVMSIKEN